MEKIIPVISGRFRQTKGKFAIEFDFKAGQEISVPSEIIPKLISKGFVEKEIKNNKKSKGDK